MTEWKEVKIGDICDTISATYRGDAEEVVLINTSDVLEGKVLNHKLSPNKNLPGQFKKTFTKYDILYSEIRPQNKRFAFVDFEPQNYIASTKLMVLRCDTTRILPEFFYLIVSGNDFINNLQLIAETRSGTFPQITFTELANQNILLPPLPIQQKIAGILSSLDDKIETNRRICARLEELAQTIFRSWFIDGANFGDATVSDYFLPKRGKTLLTSNAIDGDVPVIAGGLSPATYHNQANTTAPVITISASGANAGYVGLWGVPVWSSDSSFIDQSITPYVLFWYNMLKFNQKAIFDSQTGSAQPHIYPKHIGDIRIPDLDEKKMQQYESIVAPIYRHIFYLGSESTRLAALRDTLLPKLMSGEIDVDDACCQASS